MRAFVFMFTPMVLLAFAVISESPEPAATDAAPAAETQPIVSDELRLATASPVEVDSGQVQSRPASDALLVEERAITL